MKKNHTIVICISLICALIFSCTDEDDIIGQDIIDSDLYDVTLTSFPNENYNIPIYSLQEDSISATGSYNLLGHINDPYFGESAASFYMQILLPSNNLELNASEDTEFTIELSLPYFDSYGDTLENMEVSVFKLTENINSVDTITDIISTQTFNFDPSPLGSKVFNTNDIKDSLSWNGETVSPRLIIDLSNSDLGEIISNADLSSSESFVSYFNGFYLKSNETVNTGCITSFNTNSANCFLRVSYINNNNEPQVIEFPVGTSANKLNNFTHDYTNRAAYDYLDTGNMLDSMVFLQSMGGICSEINLGFLNEFEDSSYVISNAVLNLPVYPNELNNLFYPPGYLVLTEYDATENLDLAIEGVIGGIYNDTDQKYTFVLTDHIQKIISDNHNPVMRLYVGGKNSNAERLLIDNRASSHINLELVIIK